MQVGRAQQDAELLRISECVDRSLFVDEQSKVNELVPLAECTLQKAIIMRLGKARDGVGTGSYTHALQSIMYMLTDLLCNLRIFQKLLPRQCPRHLTIMQGFVSVIIKRHVVQGKAPQMAPSLLDIRIFKDLKYHRRQCVLLSKWGGVA